jgi:hypothetical protein
MRANGQVAPRPSPMQRKRIELSDYELNGALTKAKQIQRAQLFALVCWSKQEFRASNMLPAPLRMMPIASKPDCLVRPTQVGLPIFGKPGVYARRLFFHNQFIVVL